MEEELELARSSDSFLYGEPVGVAVQVGDNVLVVPMSPVTLEKLAKKNPQHGSVAHLVAMLQNSPSWPLAQTLVNMA
jgi:hypothetical protein